MIIDGIIFNNRQSAIEYQNKQLMLVIMMQLALQSNCYKHCTENIVIYKILSIISVSSDSVVSAVDNRGHSEPLVIQCHLYPVSRRHPVLHLLF